MNRTHWSSMSRTLTALGLGFLLVTTAASNPASAEGNDVEKCKATLLQCSSMLETVQKQRDTALAEQAQCEVSLKETQQKLELALKAIKPGGGGLTHRRALDLLELSMKALEKVPESETSSAELISATRRLRAFQEKATGLSLKLTEQATRATDSAAAPPR